MVFLPQLNLFQFWAKKIRTPKIETSNLLPPRDVVAGMLQQLLLAAYLVNTYCTLVQHCSAKVWCGTLKMVVKMRCSLDLSLTLQ